MHGNLGNKAKSADYCGATLSRQLQAGFQAHPYSHAVLQRVVQTIPAPPDLAVNAGISAIHKLHTSTQHIPVSLLLLQGNTTEMTGCRIALNSLGSTWERDSLIAGTTFSLQPGSFRSRCSRRASPLPKRLWQMSHWAGPSSTSTGSRCQLHSLKIRRRCRENKRGGKSQSTSSKPGMNSHCGLKCTPAFNVLCLVYSASQCLGPVECRYLDLWLSWVHSLPTPVC